MKDTVSMKELMGSMFARKMMVNMALQPDTNETLARKLSVAIKALEELDNNGDCHCVGVARKALKEINDGL